MSRRLRAVITSADPAVRDTPLERLCGPASLADLLAEAADLEPFRQECGNLYERVRALFFLYAIHRFHLPKKPELARIGHVPYEGYQRLLIRRFDEAISRFLADQHAQGPSDALSSSLALAYRDARRLDRAMPAPGPQTALLASLPMFAPLPLAVTDLLAAETEPRRFPAGTVVIREGEPGDHFYLIVEGSATVSVHGVRRPSLHRGDCFGEIALLRDIPRTGSREAPRQLRPLAPLTTKLTTAQKHRAAAVLLVAAAGNHRCWDWDCSRPLSLRRWARLRWNNCRPFRCFLA